MTGSCFGYSTRADKGADWQPAPEPARLGREIDETWADSAAPPPPIYWTDGAMVLVYKDGRWVLYGRDN
jgi:hypothetical protein